MIHVTVKDTAQEKLKQVARGVNVEAQRAMLKAASFAAGAITEKAKELIRPTGKDRAGPTGALARSFQAVNLAPGRGALRAGAFSDLVYARVQNEGSGYLPGGVIRPRRGKFLAIPLMRLSHGTWPRNYGGKELQFIRSRKGNFLLVEIRKRRGQKPIIKPIFLLKRSVVLAGKDYIRAALPKATRDAKRVIDEAVKRGVKGLR